MLIYTTMQLLLLLEKLICTTMLLLLLDIPNILVPHAWCVVGLTYESYPNKNIGWVDLRISPKQKCGLGWLVSLTQKNMIGVGGFCKNIDTTPRDATLKERVIFK